VEKSAGRAFVKLELPQDVTSQLPQDVTSQLPQDVTLPAGKYCLGNHIGPVCAVMWGSPSSTGRKPCVYGTHPFVNGPALIFPTQNYSSGLGALSVFATYRGALLPVAPPAPIGRGVTEKADTVSFARPWHANGSSAGNSAGSVADSTVSQVPFTAWILKLLLNQESTY
jgi:hypothetical protein